MTERGSCDCGRALVRTCPASISSPAEYGCPECDGGSVRAPTYPRTRFDVSYETARASGWDD